MEKWEKDLNALVVRDSIDKVLTKTWRALSPIIDIRNELGDPALDRIVGRIHDAMIELVNYKDNYPSDES